MRAASRTRPPRPRTPTADGNRQGDQTTGDAAKGQARAVDALLGASGAARTALRRAVTAVMSCAADDRAVSAIAAATRSRKEQLERARALAVDALDGGAALKSDLVDALEASYRADQHYLAWARKGCAGSHDPDLAEAEAFSARASAAKRRFLSRWTDLALRYGLPARAETDL